MRLIKSFFLLTILLLASPAAAEPWPTHPVRLIVPFPAGGPADTLGRIVADKLAAAWGPPVVVENRGGAGGNTAAEAVAHATADGYTLAFATNGMMATNVSLYKKIGYDPVKDFAPITIIGTQATSSTSIRRCRRTRSPSLFLTRARSRRGSPSPTRRAVRPRI